jgi:hypothetical protein
LEQSPEFGAVVHIPACKVDIGRERVFIARGKVVKTTNLVSLSGKMICERRAEKSGCAGDEKVHNRYQVEKQILTEKLNNVA